VIKIDRNLQRVSDAQTDRNHYLAKTSMAIIQGRAVTLSTYLGIPISTIFRDMK